MCLSKVCVDEIIMERNRKYREKRTNNEKTDEISHIFPEKKNQFSFYWQIKLLFDVAGIGCINRKSNGGRVAYISLDCHWLLHFYFTVFRFLSLIYRIK